MLQVAVAVVSPFMVRRKKLVSDQTGYSCFFNIESLHLDKYQADTHLITIRVLDIAHPKTGPSGPPQHINCTIV